MEKLKRYLSLFFTFFKIGLFTFGGGYGMIAVLERELVEKKKWLSSEEFTDIIAIAESTPGPIAINSATFIGYKRAKILGSAACTLGVVLPSFIIIFVISLFFDAFIKIEAVEYAFRGIQACVAFLILSAGIKMFKKLKFNAFNIIMFSLSTACLIVLTLLAVDFSTVFYVLIGGAVGVIFYALSCVVKKTAPQNNKVLNESETKEESSKEGK